MEVRALIGAFLIIGALTYWIIRKKGCCNKESDQK